MRYWFYDVAKLILWLVLRLRFGLEVTGQEHVPKTGAFVVASNHVSFLDPPVVGVACPRRLRFMARSDLFQRSLLGCFLRGVRVMPLRRGEADIGAVREACARLQEGEAVAIFPEGTRQLSGKLGRAKRGVGFLAEMAKVPIIPTFVQGTFQALPPDARALRRAKIRVAFGPPIPYTSPPIEGGASRSRHEQLAEALTYEWHRLEAQASSARMRR